MQGEQRVSVLNLKVQSIAFLGDDRDWYLSMRMSRLCGMEIKLAVLRRTKDYEATDIPKEYWNFGRDDDENDSEHSDRSTSWLLAVDVKSLRRFRLKEIYFRKPEFQKEEWRGLEVWVRGKQTQSDRGMWKKQLMVGAYIRNAWTEMSGIKKKNVMRLNRWD